MKTKTIILIMVVAVILSSCIPSLFPLYKTSDLKTDKRLEGTWRELSDDGYKWELTNFAGNNESGFLGAGSWSKFDSLRTYMLKSTNKDEDIECRSAVHLFSLCGKDYLNYYPVDWETDHEFLSWPEPAPAPLKPLNCLVKRILE